MWSLLSDLSFLWQSTSMRQCTIEFGANSNNHSSFLAGMLPLSLSLSSRQLRLITAVGTGVLVGTALIVIIPEGIETLYSASEGGGHGRTDIHTKRVEMQPAFGGGGSVAQMHSLQRVDEIDAFSLGRLHPRTNSIPNHPRRSNHQTKMKTKGQIPLPNQTNTKRSRPSHTPT